MAIGDFTEQADAYVRSRPSYPGALFDTLIAELGLSPGDRVADLGAGTGISTLLLADRGLDVTAVEPNPTMRERGAGIPGVRWVDGTFEQTGLPDSSQSWLVAAQAFHWAKPARALPELRRVLRPGGSFSVMWNNRDNEKDAVVQWTRETIRRLIPEFNHRYRDEDWAAVLASDGSFADVRYHEMAHRVPMSRERYVTLWRSNNQLANNAGPERLPRFFSALDAFLDEHYVTEVSVPYLTRCWTARRHDG